MDALGGGLVAVAFWGFVASCVVSGVWYAIREKQAQHETLQQLIASGKEINPEVIDAIVNDGGDQANDLRIAAYIVLAVAPGLVFLGWFLGNFSDKAFVALSGVAGLVFFVGLGLFAASKAAERKASKNHQPLA